MKTYGKDPNSNQLAFVRLMEKSSPADVKGFRNDFYTLAKEIKGMEECIEEEFTLDSKMVEMMREAIMKVRVLKSMVEYNEIEKES